MELNRSFTVSVIFFFLSLGGYSQFVVDNTGNQSDALLNGVCDNGSGECTLRAAIEEANFVGGSQTITFAPALSGQTINIDNPLILNADGTIIDGDIDGDMLPDIRVNSGATSNAFEVSGTNNEILYLNITGFSAIGTSAVYISTAGSANKIAGCHIGTNLAGTNTTGTGNYYGIRLDGADGNFIGDPALGLNVISGNSFPLRIENTADNNEVKGNIIGLNATGAAALGNGSDGILVDGSSMTVIGDNTTGRNYISGNNGSGVYLDSAPSTSIVGNYIGTDFVGTTDLGNSQDGITVDDLSDNSTIGDGTPGGGNTISGNNSQGVEIISDNITVLGNRIGIDAFGSLALPNTSHGVWIRTTAQFIDIGNGTVDGRNTISGNGGHGMLASGDDVTIIGNFIGVNSFGNGAVGNGIGIFVTAGTGVLIGGTAAGEGNVISANTNGIQINVPNVGVYGNLIGTNSSGTGSIPNNNGIQLSSNAQVTIIGDGTAAGRNVISGNSLEGIAMDGFNVIGNIVQGNFIGTDINGTVPLGNGNNGIFIEGDANSNIIDLNTIAHNAGNGIEINGIFAPGTASNTFSQNSIYGNSASGIAILNGAQGGVGQPVITGAVNGVNTVTISGTAAISASVEVFVDGNDEGEVYLGTTVANGAGAWSLLVNWQQVPTGLGNFTATQLTGGNSSEFSTPQAAVLPNPLVVTNTSNGLVVGSLRYAADYANTNAGADVITFDPIILDQEIILDAPIFFTDDLTTIDGDILGDCVPHISISGDGVMLPCIGNACVGLIFNSDQNTIKHLNIHSYGQVAWGQAIQLNGDDNTVIGCYVGTDLNGTDATTTQNWVGIWMEIGSINNTIGGLLACESNVVSGNDTGIVLRDTGTDILGNFIGTDPSGTSITNLGNVSGIVLGQVAVSNTIGSTNPNGRNIISGNSAAGIIMSGGAVQSNLVIGNYFGTDVNGTSALPNLTAIQFSFDATNNQIGDGTAAGRNIISGNSGDGFEIQASGNFIQGNYIGLDASGSALGNGLAGIRMTTGGNHTIGGTNPGEGNVISGNGAQGVILTDDNMVLGNLIGTNTSGTAAIPNGTGISIGGQRNQIGDGTANGLNVISGNTNNGILDWGLDNDILMNYIGVQSDGITALGNGQSGVEINFGGDDILTGNVIAYNSAYGINIRNTVASDNNIFSQSIIYGNLSGGVNIQSPSQEDIFPPVITNVDGLSAMGTAAPGAAVYLFADAADQGQYFINTTTADGLGMWTIPMDTTLFPAGLDQITALQDSASNTSAFATAVALPPPPTAPNDPSDLFTTEISSSQIDLTWADNSPDETGFTIERSDGNNSNFVILNTVAADVTSFSDNTVAAESGYFYRVIANGAILDSNPSNEKFGSTITPPGHSLDFDGNGEFVSLGDPDFSGYSALTVEAWINPAYIPNGFTDETVTIIGKGSTGGIGTTTFALVLEGSPGDIELFALVDNGSSLEVARFNGGSGFDLNEDEWVHVAMTWAANSPVRVYTNGIERDATPNLPGPLNIVGNDLLIGTSTDINEIGFEGEIDELRIWNTERSQAEIQNNMFTTFVGNEAGLEFYYRFDQGVPGGDNTTPTIDLLPDRSTNNFNGTLTNFMLNGGQSNWLMPSITAPSNLLTDGTYGLSAPEVILTWDDNSLDEADFEIQRADDAAFSIGLQTFSLGSANAGATATFTDNTVTTGNLYFYRVRAVNGPVNSSYSNTMTSVPVVESGNTTSFDNSLEFVNVQPSIQNRSEWSFTCWFDGRGYIYSEGSPAVRFYIEATNLVRVGALNGVWEIFATPYLNGEWNFLGISLTGGGPGTGTLTMVVNNTVNVTTLQTAAGSLTFAVFGKNVGSAFGGQPAFEFTGEIDEASMWSRALTSAEMIAIRDAGVPSGDPDLLGLWHFDEPNSSTLLYDVSGNDNHGTRTNGPQQVSSLALHPFAPENFDVVPVDGQAELSWTPSYITDFQQYNISYKRDVDVVYTTVTDGNQSLNSMTFAGLNNDELYNFKVSATDVVDQPGVETFNNEVPTTFFGNAAFFDGTNSEIAVADNSIFDRGSGLTLEAWVRPDNLDNTNQFLVGISNAFRLGVNVNNELEIATNDGGGAVFTSDPSGVLTQGAWTHVAMTFQGTTTNLYINGNLVDQNTSMPVPQNSSQSFRLGVNESMTTWFDGLIDEVRLWDQELDQATLQANMFTPLRGDETNIGTFNANLIGYWSCDEPAGYPVAHSTPSNEYNGTLAGNADFVPSTILPFGLSSATPLQNSINASPATDIVLTFNQAVEGMTANASNIIVVGAQTGTISGTYSGGGTNTVTFNPTGNFQPGEIVRVTLTPGLRSTSGNSLIDPVSYKFLINNVSGPEIPDFFFEDPSTIISTSIDAVQSHISDLDGDGDLDIVTAGEADDKISWFENDGSQNFTENPVPATGTGPKDLYVTDMDLDGDIDIVVAFTGSNQILWYDNNGVQVFTENAVAASAPNVEAVLPVDLDGDGDKDVVSANESAGELVWYENDGAQNFSARVIDSGLGSVRGTYAADVDSDGDLDVLGTSLFSDQLFWYQNNGAQTFTQNVIATPNGPWTAFAIDFDQDGDMDLMTGSEFADEVAWYENDGSQNFTARSVTTTADGVRWFDVKDIDADGDLDVATASDNDGKIAWYENNGAFVFTEHIVTINAVTARGVVLADIDADGDLDLVSSSQGDDKLAWYENTISVCITPPTSNAGADQTVCEGSMINLAGSIGGSASTSSWSTSGDGSFDDNTLLNAVYTPGFSDISSGSVILTLDTDDPDGGGPCIAASSSITVTIEPLPVITAQPIDVTECEGNSTSLTITSIGIALSLEWQVDTGGGFVTVVDGGVYSGATTSQLDISDVTGQNGYLYRVNVIETGGTLSCSILSNTATLTVDPLPIADAGPDQTICEGDIVILAGSIGGSASTLVWTTSGDGMFDDPTLPNATYTPGSADVGTGTVTLTLTTDDPAGPCIASNAAMNITIEPLPVITVQPADVSECPGNPVSFSVTATGIALAYQWEVDVGGGFMSITNGGVYTGATSSQLDISDGTGQDGYQYRVLITETGATQNCSIISSSANLSVSGPITAGQINQDIDVGVTLNFDVIAISTINAGDVITVTIVQAGTLGVTTLLGDNTIDYTPNTGTIGSDQIEYQICNQCGICDTNFINLNILNAPPAVNPDPAPPVNAGESLTIPIASFVSDLNGNADLSSLSVIVPPISGADAFFDSNFDLVVDYSSVPFIGQDNLTIEVCDVLGACGQTQIFIDVEAPGITVFNAVSPDGDGKHDFLEFAGIESFPENRVEIINRWGATVFTMENYNNDDRIFTGVGDNGSMLPNGTYYFILKIASTGQEIQGFFLLKMN